jgi:hypothetical protein
LPSCALVLQRDDGGLRERISLRLASLPENLAAPEVQPKTHAIRSITPSHRRNSAKSAITHPSHVTSQEQGQVQPRAPARKQTHRRRRRTRPATTISSRPPYQVAANSPSGEGCGCLKARTKIEQNPPGSKGKNRPTSGQWGSPAAPGRKPAHVARDQPTCHDGTAALRSGGITYSVPVFMPPPGYLGN